jgi:hypothetical protein
VFCTNKLDKEDQRQKYKKCRECRELRIEAQRDRRKAHALQDAPTDAPPESCQQVPGVAWGRLVWVSLPDQKSLPKDNTLAIQLYLDDHHTLGHDPWLAAAQSMTTLPNTVVRDADDGCHYQPEGIVTLLAIEVRTKQMDRPICFKKFTVDQCWPRDQYWARRISESCKDEGGQALHTLIFVHGTTEEPENPGLDAVYRAIALLKPIMCSYGFQIRAYPSETEAAQERDKLGDIRALDEVAQPSPQQFSH